jgi:hypothetical protein
LDDGPAYIFSNASAVRFEDHTGKVTSMEYTDSMVWISKASCLKISVDPWKHGRSSLIVVSSGAPSMTGKSDTSSCKAATILVGTPALSRNEVSYRITPEGSCKNGLNHGRDGYSNLDMPIHPVGQHYHTRGSLYYVLYGQSDFNDTAIDTAIDNDFLLGGELRYVAPGIWYGPETMTGNAYVASIHEVDPSSIVHYPTPSPTPNLCKFACLEEDATPGLCVKAKAEAVADTHVV